MILDIKLIFFCSVIGTLLYALSIFMPLIGGIISFFSPLPLGYVAVKRDKRSLYICFLLTVLLLMFVSGKLGTFLYLLQYGVPTVLFFEIYFRGVNEIKSVLYTIVAMLIIALITLMVNYSFDLNRAFTSMVNFLNLNFKVVLDGYKSLGVSEEDIKTIATNLNSFAKTIVKILPSFMVIFYCSIFLLNLPLIERISKTKFRYYNLNEFKMPFLFIWIFIVSGFGLYFLGRSTIWWILLNIFIIVCFGFLIQGFMVLECWFNRFKFTKFMKNLFYILILFSQFLLISIAIIGLFDNWFDFRKKILSGGSNENNS
jgi:uncharacterized protein YybS (DUF2232 family)